jgi:hypothetical protein
MTGTSVYDVKQHDSPYFEFAQQFRVFREMAAPRCILKDGLVPEA